MDVFCMNINPLLRLPDKQEFLKHVLVGFVVVKDEVLGDICGGINKEIQKL